MRTINSISVAGLCAALLLALGVQSAQAQAPAEANIDNADASTGWTSGNTLSVDTTIKVFGAASLKSEGSARDRFRKVLATPVDIRSYRYLTFWYYVDRPDLLYPTTGSFANDAGQIELTSSGTFDSFEMNWSVLGLHLQRGWNYVVLDLPGKVRDAFEQPNTAAMNYLRVYHRPQASVVTRIDNIVFTNRDPESFAFADLLRRKRIAASPASAEQLDDVFGFIMRTLPGSAARAKYCRRMTIDLTHYDINGFTLQSMGVSFAAVNNEMREKTFIKELVCGQATMARSELISHLQNRALTEVAVVGEIASLFDLTMEAAAETRLTTLDIDLQRILQTCSSDATEIDTYINSGALPPSFPGANVLVKQCVGTSANIAGSLATLGTDLSVSTRRATYKQCMALFESQGSQCDNPYANENEDYDKELKRIYGGNSQAIDAAKAQMQTYLQMAHLTVEAARASFGTTSPNPAQTSTTMIQLHRDFDQAHGSARTAEALRNSTTQPPPQNETPAQRETRFAREKADSDRLAAERKNYDDKREDARSKICDRDKTDTVCRDIRASNGPRNPTVSASRCANMELDGTNAWFDNPRAASGQASQVKEADRVDHCLCELFDRGYNQALPGNIAPLVSNCPTPEEKLAQKCIENPYSFDGPIDPGTGGGSGGRVRLECRHLMQPASLDRDALGGQLCDKIMPNCTGTAVMNGTDGKCSCPTVTSPGVFTHPSCASVPNCTDGVVVTTPIGCFCQPYDSGGNSCKAGGKDFFLTANPTTDLKVREFPTRPGFANINMLMPRTGQVAFVTSGIKRSQLRNEALLQVRAGLPGGSYACVNPSDPACVGNIKVSCTKTQIGSSGLATVLTQNRLIETIALSTLTTSGPTVLNINLSADERAACYGNGANINTHFEFAVDSRVGKPVAFFDILDELGSIKPPCITSPRPGSPTPGPRPLDLWGLSNWTLSSGVSVPVVFNGTGTIPVDPPQPPPSFPLCFIEGVLRPCP